MHFIYVCLDKSDQVNDAREQSEIVVTVTAISTVYNVYEITTATST